MSPRPDGTRGQHQIQRMGTPVCAICKKPFSQLSPAAAHGRCLDIKGRMIRHNPEYFAELRAMPHNKFKTDEEIYWEYIA